MNYKGIKDKIHVCLFCRTEFTKTRYGKNIPKYCCLKCQHEHRKQQTNTKLDEGLVFTSEAQRRVLSERYGYCCSTCNISSWNGQPLMLQVDHIDGDPSNNKAINLRLLCPNCHSQTPTYKGGNIKHPKLDRRSITHRRIYQDRKSGRLYR